MVSPGFSRRPGASSTLRPAKLTDFKMAGALGSGATTRVYDAVHIVSGQQVAIKVLEPTESGSEIREQFAREAVLLASVSSPYVGSVLSYGFERGQPFLVLERLHGETLDAKLRRDGPVPLPIAVGWIDQLLLGVRDCHDCRIIHRDIKPSNIFVQLTGGVETVKLIDFGVARLREITGDLGGLTASHHLIGSMGYMAPEQYANAAAVDFTADLYTVGVVVFRALSGRLPFVSRSLEAVVEMKRSQAPPRMSTMANMPKSRLLDWFVDKALSREVCDRFQSAEEMLVEWRNVATSLALCTTSGALGTPVLPPGRMAQPPWPADDGTEDRTLREQTASLPASLPASSCGELTLDLAPTTVPSASTPDVDMPTQSDPTLPKRVEMELEHHRRRKPPPK